MGRPKQQRIRIGEDLDVVAQIGASPPKMESTKLRKWDEVVGAVDSLKTIKGTSPWMELRGFPGYEELMHCKNQITMRHSKGKLKRSRSFKLKMTNRREIDGLCNLWVRKERKKVAK